MLLQLSSQNLLCVYFIVVYFDKRPLVFREVLDSQNN